MRFSAGMAGILTRRNVVPIAGGGTLCPKGAGFHFILLLSAWWRKRAAGSEPDGDWRVESSSAWGRTGIAQVSQRRIAFVLGVFGRSNLSGDRTEWRSGGEGDPGG